MRNQLTMKTPAGYWTARWREALPAGNGEYGISVYGAAHEETILMNHEALWGDVARPPLPDITDKLVETRENLLEGKFLEAQQLMTEGLEAAGYQPMVASPIPLADLLITTPVAQPYRDYSRTLDMETGVITVTWRDGETRYLREAFVSRRDKLVVIRQTAAGGTLEGVTLGLDIHDTDNAFKPFGLPDEPAPSVLLSEAGGGTGEGILRLAASWLGEASYGAVALLRTDGALLPQADSTLRLVGGSEVLVLVRLFCQEDVEDALEREAGIVDAINMDYDTLLARHIAVHRPLFLSTRFSLGEGAGDVQSGAMADTPSNTSNEELLLKAFSSGPSPEMMEKLWAYGRYLLISASGESGQPCPLLGLWHGDYRAMWTFHMLNENLQMIYWQALSGNMPQLLGPVFDYYESMLEDYRDNAKKLFGCRGIFIPAVSTPYVGTIQCTASHIINWTAGAAWLCQHYYDAYLYTGDEDFLHRRALPFMAEAALFYEDFMVEGADGNLVFAPSVSPENSPANFCGADFEGPEVAVNATMDIAAVKELLQNLLRSTTADGPYAEKRPVWQALLDKLPAYGLTKDGAVREWQWPGIEENNHHRHLSHLYPVFPGREVTIESAPELCGHFYQSVKNRQVIGISQQTSWSLAHMACVYARLNQGGQALSALEHLCRNMVMSNFLMVHNDFRHMGIGMSLNRFAPPQIDASMGFTAAVQEMLLFSGADGSLRVLGALPEAWPRGSVSGLLAVGGIVVDIDWDVPAGCGRLRLTPKKTGTVAVHLPGGIEKAVPLEQPGRPVELAFSL